MYLRKFYAIWIFLGLVVLAACGEPKLPSPYQAADVSARYTGADFLLSDPAGKARNLAAFKDKVVVLFFGYTHCPDVCPTTLADMAQVMTLLDKQANQVQVLFVTLDPERDTASMLAQYVPAFYPSFMGLRGDAQATNAAAKAFGVSYQKQGKGSDYTLDHTAGSYLIGRGGKPVLLAPYGQRPELLAQDIRLLLATTH